MNARGFKMANEMDTSARRMILVTSAKELPSTFEESGFHPLQSSQVFAAFHAAGLWLGPRDVLEHLPSFRQIIPYVVLRVGDRFVRYTRTPAGREGRLHGRMSLGLGGHIDLSDIVSVNDCVDLEKTLGDAARREVDEELGSVDCVSKEWIGVLVDNDTDVGQVHIGVVAIWDLSFLPLGVSEDAIGEVELCSIEDLENSRDRLEGWSEMLLEYITDPSLSRSVELGVNFVNRSQFS